MKLNVHKMVYNKDFLCKIIYNKNYRVPVFNTFKLKQICSETLIYNKNQLNTLTPGVD